MTTDDEIIEDTFPIAHYDSEKERKYVEEAMRAAMKLARADAIAHRDAQILEAIRSAKKTSIAIDLTEYDNKIRTTTAKEIFKELDKYYDSSVENCSRVIIMHRHTYIALKKKMGIEG